MTLRMKELHKIEEDGTFEAKKIRDNPSENEQVLEKIRSQSRQNSVESIKIDYRRANIT